MFPMFDAEADKKKEEERKGLDREILEHFVEKRQLFLWGQVDDESMAKIIKQLLWLNSKNHDPITLFINSPGGVISSGLALYDLMQTIESPVSTVVTGQAASMGAVLSTAGRKGLRYAWPNSRIMIHQPLIQGQFYGPAADIEIQAEEMLRVRNTLNAILADHSGKSADQIEKDTDRDHWLSAEQAVAYGLIDKVATII
jgi:ATP-dependent Clp protease protease subunit